MSITRRNLLLSTGALALSGLAAPRISAAAASPAVGALESSGLIYLTPVLRNGDESTCHGEVWFVYYEDDIFVVTKRLAWRTQAIQRGLTTAKIWIGEFGRWTRAKDRYRAAPYLEISGSIERDPAVHTAVLGIFGGKYPDEWDKWGPRFRDGLADGSRVMLRYTVMN